jgi:uncharacterized phiE125 gp8 family phage protein
MMLVEDSQIPEAALPVAALRRHLRMGTGFAEDDLQDAVLGSFLRAAMAAIEARSGKALIRRGFVLTLPVWSDPARQRLPLSPVAALTELAIVDAWGATQVIAPERYRLEADQFTPHLMPRGGHLPAIPPGGSAELRFEAGFGADFAQLPPDLAQAVLLLAAHYYDYRDETGLSQGCMPFGVTSLLARYRPVRLGLGT